MKNKDIQTSSNFYISNLEDERACAHVYVSGNVQGVGYRASTSDAATLLKLDGWVRNLRDGRVEAVFEGPEHQVEEMIRWCHQGPPTATVREVVVEYTEPKQHNGFHITR
ncbi:MAG: acylphosphatase [Cyanobacteria bacterium J06633_2]